MVGFHFFRHRVNWMIWDMLRRRQKRSSQPGAVRTCRKPEVGLPGWESRQTALMQGRNPYAVPERPLPCPNNAQSAMGAPGGLPGWESRQAALMQGRNPYLVPERSQLSPEVALNISTPGGKDPSRVPSFARGSLSESSGTEAVLRGTRRLGRGFRVLFWIGVVSAAVVTIGATMWAVWRAGN